jgi:hypothetical protein
MLPETMPCAPDIERAANVRYHVQVLRDKAFRRRVIFMLNRSMSQCTETGAEFGEIVSEMEESIDEIRETYQVKRKNITEAIREWVTQQDGIFLVTDCYKDLELATKSNKSRNPNGSFLKFTIVAGAKFIPDSGGWRKE